MLEPELIISGFIVLWAAIDPIGTLPVFLAVTKGFDSNEKIKIAKSASIVAFFILTFFLFAGESLLRNAGVPLSAFQASGGIILFMFAMNMIFGDSKPEQEINLAKKADETAVFPLAIPSIAGPGAILAVVLLADGAQNSFTQQIIITLTVASILSINFLLMYFSKFVHAKIGNVGAIVISKVMGLLLASIALNNVLVGLKSFFNLS